MKSRRGGAKQRGVILLKIAREKVEEALQLLIMVMRRGEEGKRREIGGDLWEISTGDGKVGGEEMWS